MYGKFHASAFTGSMRGSGPVVFAVWAYVVSNTNQHSVIEINPDVVAFLLGCSPAEVDQAIDTLCAPDARSRCKENEGRRLIKEGEYQYFVPTHKHYREMKNTEEKRQYNRVKKQEERQRKADVKQRVKNVKLVNTSEAEAEAQTKEEAEALALSAKQPLAPSVMEAPSVITNDEKIPFPDTIVGIYEVIMRDPRYNGDRIALHNAVHSMYYSRGKTRGRPFLDWISALFARADKIERDVADKKARKQ